MFRTVLMFLLFVLVACQPTERSSAPIIVTPPLLATLSGSQIDDAQRAAINFMEAWVAGDYETMYNLITFSSQDANPYESFVAAYQAAAAEMTLESVRYQPLSLSPDGSRAIVLTYDATFNTNILGSFADSGRSLHVLLDESRNGEGLLWHVAWSAGDIFEEMANGARLRLERIVPSRANIYDRSGNIMADQNGRVITVNIIKEDIRVYDDCLNTLARVLEKPREDLEAVLAGRASNQLIDIGTIEPAIYTQESVTLEAACAATFADKPVRRYTNPITGAVDGTLAPHILGYVGYVDEAQIPEVQAAGFDADAILGRSGIEGSWDETLRGTPGGRLIIQTPGGQRLRVLAESTARPAESVWLTIDADLQNAAEQAIADAYEQSRTTWAGRSNGAAAVVMDLHTGEILAMVSYPTFDNNVFNPNPAGGRSNANTILEVLQNDPRRPQLNRATLGTYPAASVMKTFTAMAAANSGVYALDQRFTCPGFWNRENGFTRGDWLPGGHGTVTLPQAVTQSCDPYFYEAGYQMDLVDPFILPNHARMLGLGNLTGLRELQESPGVIPDPDWLRVTYGLNWTFSDTVNMSIGQGFVEVTPLQIARAFAAVGNGGTLLRPLLVQQVGILGEAPSFTTEPDIMDQLTVREDVMLMIERALCDVTVTRAGTAEYIFRGFEVHVCGKTGTAEDGLPGDDTPPHAWFAAYAPAEQPEIAIAVIVENSGEGSAVAAPIVRRILEYYFGTAPEDYAPYPFAASGYVPEVDSGD